MSSTLRWDDGIRLVRQAREDSFVRHPELTKGNILLFPASG